MHLVPLQYVAGGEIFIFRQQDDLATDFRKPLALMLAIYHDYHDMAMSRIDGAINDDDLPVENSHTNHTFPIYPAEVDMGRSDIEMLINREVSLDMVICGRRKAGWDFCRVNRNLYATFLDGTENSDAHANAFNDTVRTYS